MAGIEPFDLAIGEDRLDDLRQRLALTRLPDAETVDGWEQGVPLSEARRLLDYWQNRYDWRRCEAKLNALGQFTTVIDGVTIHFLHIRSPEACARPLIMTHGWPGSVVEFLEVAEQLADPVAHGGRAEDAFHVVLPSLPGYGFSGHPQEGGWDTAQIARAWAELMSRLGYERFLAQGGDWGSSVSLWLAHQFADRVDAIHINLALAFPPTQDLDEDGQQRMAELQEHSAKGRGYSEQQSTRPQTLGYGLADSPMGQACWIYEKFREWSDAGDDPMAVFGADRLLDNIMLYWFGNAGASSARLYWESLSSFAADPGEVPVGVTTFKREIYRPKKEWAQAAYPSLRYFNECDEGGHFAAFEVPDLFVGEVRAAFGAMKA